MTIQKFSRLPALSQICTLCNKYLESKDIAENNYIESYKKRRYVLAHRTCYNNYLKWVKNGGINEK